MDIIEIINNPNPWNERTNALYAPLADMDDECALEMAARVMETCESRMAELAVPQAKPDGFAGELENLLLVGSLNFDGAFSLAKREITDEDAIEIMKATASVVNSGGKNHNVSMWVLGNIASILKDHNADFSWITQETEYALNTIQAAQRTFDFFGGKKEACPYSHHKEIAHMRGLGTDLGRRLAMETSNQGWTVTTLRRAGKALRNKLMATPDMTDEEFSETITEAIDNGPIKTKTYLRVNGNDNELTQSAEPPVGEGLIVEVKRVVQAAEPDTRTGGVDQAHVATDTGTDWTAF